MSDTAILPCPSCSALNRLPHARLADGPRCGQCKTEVLPAAPFELSQDNFSRQLKG